MSKSKIVALLIVFIVTMLPGLVLLWLGVFGFVFNSAAVGSSVALFAVGLVVSGMVVDTMD